MAEVHENRMRVPWEGWHQPELASCVPGVLREIKDGAGVLGTLQRAYNRDTVLRGVSRLFRLDPQ
jgi:hypothetical protein